VHNPTENPLIQAESKGTLTNAPVCKGAPSEIRGLD